jgi:dephospho-CoA kinase
MIVGLTGGIGSGKTTVSKVFRELGIPVYDSDLEAKQLMISSQKVKKSIIALLGKKAYQGKRLNKTYISNKIFTNETLLKKINAIVHPAVKNDFLTWMKKQDSPYVIQETALIFENMSQDFYDKVILVTAPKDVRVRRVMKRDDSFKQDVLARIENQLDDSKKISLSDYVIENNELSKTIVEVKKVHIALLDYS